jgi:hypothetical protein
MNVCMHECMCACVRARVFGGMLCVQATGYAQKPIDGHGGKQIHLVRAGQPPVADADADPTVAWVYQELCALPTFLNHEHHVQVNCVCAGGQYAGTVLRVAAKPIIDLESGVYALRVLDEPVPVVTAAAHPTASSSATAAAAGGGGGAAAAAAGSGAMSPGILKKKPKPVGIGSFVSSPEDDPVVDSQDEEARVGKVAPFGKVIGVTLGGIPCYSCDYGSASRAEFPSRASYLSQSATGVYVGAR